MSLLALLPLQVARRRECRFRGGRAGDRGCHMRVWQLPTVEFNTSSAVRGQRLAYGSSVYRVP